MFLEENECVCAGMAALLLDVRSREEFESGRPLEAVPGRLLWLPLSELADRWFELPPVQTMASWTWVVRDEGHKIATLAAIEARFGGPCPYPLAICDWSVEKARLAVEGLIRSGEVRPSPLWSPSPVLSAAIGDIEASLASLGIPQPWSCVDVGCGSGRDAAFLVSRGGWKVMGKMTRIRVTVRLTIPQLLFWDQYSHQIV